LIFNDAEAKFPKPLALATAATELAGGRPKALHSLALGMSHPVQRAGLLMAGFALDDWMRARQAQLHPQVGDGVHEPNFSGKAA